MPPYIHATVNAWHRTCIVHVHAHVHACLPAADDEHVGIGRLASAAQGCGHRRRAPAAPLQMLGTRHGTSRAAMGRSGQQAASHSSKDARRAFASGMYSMYHVVRCVASCLSCQYRRRGRGVEISATVSHGWPSRRRSVQWARRVRAGCVQCRCSWQWACRSRVCWRSARRCMLLVAPCAVRSARARAWRRCARR